MNVIIRKVLIKDLDVLAEMQVEFEEFFQDIGCEKYCISYEDRKRDIEDIILSIR